MRQRSTVRRTAFRVTALAAVGAVLAPLIGDAMARTSIRSAARDVAVASRPIAAFDPSDPGRDRFGRLRFLGGLVLTSPDPDFGSFSGLLTGDHGRDLLAVGDRGTWFVARLDSDAAGRPRGVHAARIAPIRDRGGRPLLAKNASDAESLTLVPGEAGVTALVGFEGRNTVEAHRARDFAGLLASPAGAVANLPTAIRHLPGNNGLEAIAVAPAAAPDPGRLVLIAEDPPEGDADLPGWIVGGSHPGSFRLVRSDGFSATDAAFLPDGDLLVLERKVSLLDGFVMRLRRVAGAALRFGATVDGEVLIEANWSTEIDNMEGLAVDTAPDGGTILTLVSDDNAAWYQRTVLLRFRLEAAVDPAAGR